MTQRKVIDLAPRRFHVFSRAIPSDASIEDQMKANSKKMEAHIKAAEVHRAKAKDLVEENKRLAAARSPQYVQALEAERGLA